MKFKLSKDKTDGLNDFETLDELNQKVKEQKKEKEALIKAHNSIENQFLVVIIVNIIVSTVMFCYKEEIMNYISGLF
jgi:hypothetical protein